MLGGIRLSRACRNIRHFRDCLTIGLRQARNLYLDVPAKIDWISIVDFFSSDQLLKVSTGFDSAIL